MVRQSEPERTRTIEQPRRVVNIECDALDYRPSATDVQSATPQEMTLPFIADDIDGRAVPEPKC